MVELAPAENLTLSPAMSVDAQSRRLAVIAVLASIAVFFVLAPFAKVQLAPVAAFIPIYESALLLNDLVTAVMLLGHFRILRSRALLVLACAYLFTALITIPHALTFPGVFAPAGLLGAGSQSTAWLYVFWHVGFPVCVMAYARLRRQEALAPRPLARPGRAVLLGIGAVLVGSAAFTALATAGHDALPAILEAGRYTLAGNIILTATWVFSAIAIAMLWRSPKHAALDLWLLVVMVAWMCDIALSAVLNAGRFDLGFYAGRIFGLLAASYVLIALLLESNKLLARLAVAHENALQRSAELQRMHAQSEHRASQYASALEELHFKDEEIRAIVQNIVDCVLTTDERGTIISANPAVQQVFGFAQPDVVGRHLSVLVPELELRDKVFIRDGEVEGLHHDGRHVPLELAMTDFIVHGMHRYLVVLRDISERKKFVAELRRAQSDAEQANRAKSGFLSNMSHELRTPLNAILGFGQVLASDTLPLTPEKRKDFTGHIIKAGKHLLALINEVLDLAKVESGTLSLSTEPVELREVLDACKAMIAPAAGKRDIQLSFHIEPGLHVLADRTRLKQVLLNLLSNAVKYNRQGGFVNVTATGAPSGQVCITVQDQGHGLTQAHLAQLFQPFNRLGREGGDQEGTGIGLVLTKRLVELMGGAIGVSSTVGMGCEFWIELQSAAPAKAAGANLGGIAAVAVVQPMQAARTVLYVEDNPANLALVEEIMAFRTGFTLLSAADAATGIDLARRHLPDLVLLDINLPDMNGNDALRLLRTCPGLGGTPVIALSANAMPNDVARSMAAGFHCYLTKPIDIDELLAAVDSALAGAAAGKAMHMHQK